MTPNLEQLALKGLLHSHSKRISHSQQGGQVHSHNKLTHIAARGVL